MEYCVYGLIDPISKELRYIGYSYNYLERYKKHLFPSSLAKKSHKSNWILNLLSNGFKPEIFILEKAFSHDDAKEREIDLIAYYKSIGCDLTNLTVGGDGRAGFGTSLEVREKIRQSMLGKNTKPEIKANCLFCKKEFYFKAKYIKRQKYCCFICSCEDKKQKTKDKNQH